ncbi:MAG: hypothetical protein L7F78_09295 [Syntrophales bacterium LBB04]|nr:hypothetical protein [Syntrophales bacterium LBB04]
MTVKAGDISDSSITIPSIKPYGSYSVRLVESDDLKTGWCQVLSNIPVTGLLVYQYSEAGKVISEATVYPAFRLEKMVVAAPQFGLYNDTGIAMANPNGTPLRVSMQLLQLDGSLATPLPVAFTLNPGEQKAQFLSEYFKGVSTIPEGVVEITSTQGILAVGLLYRFQTPIQGNNIFTTIPVLPVP